MQITAKDFEDRVFEVARVLIKLRCPREQLVNNYDYSRRAKGVLSVADWLSSRVNHLIDPIQYDVIDGRTYRSAHGNTNMETLRQSYDK